MAWNTLEDGYRDFQSLMSELTGGVNNILHVAQGAGVLRVPDMLAGLENGGDPRSSMDGYVGTPNLYTGWAALYPPLTISAVGYYQVSMNAGVLQTGISDTGTLYAINANVSGTITAGAGAIGGFLIGATTLTDAAGTMGLSSAVTAGDDIRFWAGNTVPASAPFSVTESGIITLKSNTYPAASYLQWKSTDTSVVTGQLISDYAGAAVNTGLRVIGQAHDGAVRGYVALWAQDNSGTLKSSFLVDTNGSATLDFTPVNGAAGSTSLLIKAKTTATSVPNTVFSLETQTTGVVANGLGPSMSYRIQNSAGSIIGAGVEQVVWSDKTSGSEDAQYGISLMVAGVLTTSLSLDSIAGLVVYKGPLAVTEQATPTTPGSGFAAYYAKTDNNPYFLSDSGTEVRLETSNNKDATGGYAGLTLFKINFKNTANTFTSLLTNTNTAARTYTFKDADGTVAFTSDITGTNSGTNTGDQVLRTPIFGYGALGTVALSSTAFMGPGQSLAPSATEADVRVMAPFTGTLKNLRLVTRGAQPATGSLVVTVRVANADTSITFTVTAGAAAGSFSDVSNTAAVTAGQVISLKLVNNALAVSATIGTWSLEYDAT